MLQRSTEPVELCHHQLVAGAVCRQQRLIELRPARELARRLVDKHRPAARRLERIVLSLHVLIASGDATVADPHATERIANAGKHYIAAYTPKRYRHLALFTPGAAGRGQSCLANDRSRTLWPLARV